MRLRSALLACAGLALASCRAALPVSPLPPDDPRPQALLEDWTAHAGGREALRGRLRLAVDAPGDGMSGSDRRIRQKLVLVLARPSLLRVEIQGFLGTTAAVLATDGESYALLRSESRSFESGPVDDDLLWHVARLALRPDEVVDLLLGSPQPAAGFSVAGAYDAGEGHVRIALADERGEVRRQVEFDALGRLRWIEAREGIHTVVWKAHFDDYALVDGHPFAHTLLVELSAGRVEAKLALRDVELNPSLPPDIFTLEPPSGVGDGG